MGRLISFQVDWVAPNGNRLQIYDNGTVCYAYWFDNTERIVADVWLYNVDPAPLYKPWKDKESLPPYLNPREYIHKDLDYRPTKNEIESEWVPSEDRIGAKIYLRSEVTSIIYPGDKPGRSRLVKKNGPLAHVW